MFVLPRATDETAVYLALMRISDENTVLMHPSTTLFLWRIDEEILCREPRTKPQFTLA